MGESEPQTALDAVDLDDLLREVMQRVDGVLDEQARLRLLLDAVVTMAADLSLDGVLDRILTIARTLVGARYAAVGVLEGGPGRRLRTFVHQGMPAEQVDQVGDLPSGLGLLGVITDRTEPLRIRDISEHPESYGFPPHHPPMHSFLGVPVQIRGRLFGNLYLTEKDGGGDFTPEDERIVVALAAAAGVAIENARLYEEAARREAWLEATAEITALLSEATMSPEALETVVNHLRAAADSDVAWVATGDDPSELGLRAVAGLPVDTANLRSVSLEGTLSAQVVETGLAISVPGLHETAPHPCSWATASAGRRCTPRSWSPWSRDPGSRACSAWRGCRSGCTSTTRSTSACPLGSRSRRGWPSRSPAPVTTSSAWPSSRTATGSVATSTTW